MDIYYLICCHERNIAGYTITRILKCIPTTLEEMEKEHNKLYYEYMRMHHSMVDVFPMLISRHEDLSFLTKEAECNA